MFRIGSVGIMGGTGGTGTPGTPPPVITPTAISLSATSVTLPVANAGAFVATITITATGGTYAGPVTIGGADAAKFALSHSGIYPCNLLVGASNITTNGTYNITLTATPVTTPFAIGVTLVVTPTAISLSATSITFPNPTNANATVATITVTASGGTYAGPVTIGGTDAAKFALSNGGVYPCNLLVGATNIGTNTYNITLTATPITTPFAIAVTVVTATAIALSATSINTVGTANAGATVGIITVTATGGTYTGPVTISGTNASLFALSNSGNYPCNLLIGAANVLAGTYSISLTASPVVTPFSIAVTLTAPAFVPTADGVTADIYMDFVGGNYWGAAPAPSTSPPAWMFSRAGVAWGDNTAGVWSMFTTGVPVITNKGLICSLGSINIALQSRDMTQAVWVKTSMTAARSQVGIDNAANSANLLTATAANATVLQSITAASNTYITSFFLKRSVGTGVVNITTDGGTTWTAVTLTTSFTRPFRNQAAVTNPSIGIQIVTSGDAVIADFAQCEIAQATLAVPSTPSSTTTTTGTRSADSISIPATVGSAITLLATATPVGGQVGTAVLATINDGSSNNRLYVGRAVTNARDAVNIGGTGTNIVFTQAWTDVPGKIVGSGSSGAFAGCFNAGTVTSVTPTGYPTGMNQINFGSGTGGTAAALWYITSIAVWLNHAATNAALIGLTGTTGTATSISLSTTSVSFATPMDANSFVAHITVTAVGGGTYVGVLTLGGADGSKFALSNGGNYPCDLMVGPANIAANTSPGYAIALTANP